MHRESFNLRLWIKTGLYRSAYSRVEWQDENFSLILVEPKTEDIIAMATLNTPGVVFEKGDVLRVWSGERVATHTIDEPPQKPFRFNFNDRPLVPEGGPPGRTSRPGEYPTMEKHPCLQCERMPRGQNMEVEPCASCREPENYCNRIGPAGVGSVPYRISDYQPRKENPMETTPSTSDPAREAGTPSPEMFTCKACETPKPRTTEYFAPHARTKDGLHTTCRDCMGKLIGKGHKNRKRKSPSKKKADPTPASVPPRARPPKTERRRVKRDLNFYGHEDLMKAIEEDAATQFRKFNAHVLFILQRHVDQQKTGLLQ